jgi:acylphosphatase
MPALQVVISGRVQGVGYRAWVADEAQRRELSGWVRNRRDGTVEAVLAARTEVLDDMLAACRDGPPAAQVRDVEATPTDEPAPGFRVLPTE